MVGKTNTNTLCASPSFLRDTVQSFVYYHACLWPPQHNRITSALLLFPPLSYIIWDYISFFMFCPVLRNTPHCKGVTNSAQPLAEQASVYLYWEAALVSCRSPKSIYKASIFTMIYWKQQLVLIKPSQNIKLIEPTAVQGIHNTWSKSFKIFTPIEYLQSL